MRFVSSSILDNSHSMLHHKFLPSYLAAPRTEKEAMCLLNLARTSRSIEETRKKLAKQRAKEHRYLAQLYELQARNAGEQLIEADLDIGRATSAVRQNSSLIALPSPAMALRRYRTRGTMLS